MSSSLHKKGEGPPYDLYGLIIEDSKENTFHTISVTQNTHRSASSLNLSKGSLDEIRSRLLSKGTSPSFTCGRISNTYRADVGIA